jgi:hypothetical protein
MGSVTAEPVTRRADQLVVGDRILHEFLPSPWFKESGEVVFVKVHNYRKGRYVFVAYMQDNGFYDSTSYQPDGTVGVIPADPSGLSYSRVDDGALPQPVAGRVPAHFADGQTGAELSDEASAAELGERADEAIREFYGEPVVCEYHGPHPHGEYPTCLDCAICWPPDGES